MKGQARQKGMTLLELLVGMGVATIIMGGTLGLIFQEVRGTAVARTSVTAAHEIGNAARWISQDVMMAESTDLTEEAGPVDSLTLSWTERYDFTNIPHSSGYTLEGTELRRDYDGTVTTVGRDISGIEFSQDGGLLTVSISVSPRWWAPRETVQKTYQVYLRAAGGS